MPRWRGGAVEDALGDGCWVLEPVEDLKMSLGRKEKRLSLLMIDEVKVHCRSFPSVYTLSPERC